MPRRWLLPFLLASCATAAPLPDASLVLTDVAVVDVRSGTVLPPADVVIEGGRIVSIGGSEEIAEGARVVDGRGRWLAPALWDMHVHLSKARAAALPLFVVNGVLGVRDVGGEMEELFRWRSEIREGQRAGPRIVAAGPYLEAPANVLRVLMSETVEPEERTRVPVASPADARRVVDSIAAAGVDFVKVRTWPDLETFHAIAEAAALHGLPLAAHTFTLSPDELRAGRVASVEHFYEMPGEWSEAERGDFWRDLARAGVVVVPTLVNVHESLFVTDTAFARVLADTAGVLEPRRPHLSAYLLADWAEQVEERSAASAAGWRSYYPTLLESFREAHAAGVRLLAGSDLAVIGIYPGSSLHRDVELFEDEIGMTPAEALRSATLHPAEFLGLDDSLGTVEAGKIADLVLLDADPLADVSNTRRIVAVIQGGRYLDRAELDRLRDSVRSMPSVVENDWLPAPPGPELTAAIALEAALAGAGTADEVAAALDRYRDFDGAERLPGGRAALGARVEAAVNQAGYRLLQAERVDEAIAVFEANTEAFPASANAWDSLAEGHMNRGDRDLAVRHYRKSLELDPENDNAREKLAELGAARE